MFITFMKRTGYKIGIYFERNNYQRRFLIYLPTLLKIELNEVKKIIITRRVIKTASERSSTYKTDTYIPIIINPFKSAYRCNIFTFSVKTRTTSDADRFFHISRQTYVIVINKMSCNVVKYSYSVKF